MVAGWLLVAGSLLVAAWSLVWIASGFWPVSVSAVAVSDSVVWVLPDWVVWVFPDWVVWVFPDWVVAVSELGGRMFPDWVVGVSTWVVFGFRLGCSESSRLGCLPASMGRTVVVKLHPQQETSKHISFEKP